MFSWPEIAQKNREPFLLRIFGDAVNSRYLSRLDRDLVLANPDLVPFMVIGPPALTTDGTTFETRLDAHVTGVLFLDLDHGASHHACPILLWDMKRFGRVAGSAEKLKLQLGGAGPVSNVTITVPLRVFHKVIQGRIHYWQIEVSGRHVKMQRGRFKADGQKDWVTNEIKEANFPSSADARSRAEELIQKYVGEGYFERPA